MLFGLSLGPMLLILTSTSTPGTASWLCAPPAPGDRSCANASTSITLVRDPFARFLSGYNQVEVFAASGLFGKDFSRADGDCGVDSSRAWFRDFCLVAAYAGGAQCPGNPFNFAST